MNSRNNIDKDNLFLLYYSGFGDHTWQCSEAISVLYLEMSISGFERTLCIAKEFKSESAAYKVNALPLAWNVEHF